jgi:short-subunit dehydrogenase
MTSLPENQPSSAARNRTALITGASSGIGEEYARQLAAKRYNLVLVARREDRLRAIRDELTGKYPIDVDVCVADLAKPQEVERVAEQIGQMAGLELLINNAGFGTMGPFAEIDVARQLEMVQVHLAATLRLTRAALPGMIQRRRGTIINVSSMAGFIIAPGSTTYGATKAFLNHFSESLQVELAGTGVRVQSLCPGFTYTGFHDTPDLARFDRTQIPRGMWMSSDAVVADSLRQLESGGVICIPGFKNRWLARLLSFRLVRKLLGKMVRKRPK